MEELKWKILGILAEAKEPMRAAHIAKALKKSTAQTQIKYHLRRMIEYGLVLVYEDSGAERYAAQLLLTSKRVRGDFYAVFAGATPKLQVYIDGSRATRSPVDVMLWNIMGLLEVSKQQLERDMNH